jgi:translation elongation factor EF-1alpha
VTHYYDKIGVAVVHLDNPISVGDNVVFIKDGEEIFRQTIDSIQIEHEKRESAERGEIIGLKIEEPVKEGTEIFKV